MLVNLVHYIGNIPLSSAKELYHVHYIRGRALPLYLLRPSGKPHFTIWG